MKRKPHFSTTSVLETVTFTDTNSVSSHQSVVCGLTHGQVLQLQGSYTAQIIKGCVEIGGVALTSSPVAYPVITSNYQPINCIQCVPKTPGSVSLPPEVPCPAELREYSAVVLIKSFENKFHDLKYMDSWGPVFDNQVNPHQDHLTFWASNSLVHSKPLCLPESWKSLLPHHQPPTLVITGRKMVGKSTLARFWTNKLAASHGAVQLLEADPSKPAFGPKGCLSLVKFSSPCYLPPLPALQHANLAQHPSVQTSHFFGHVDPRDCPQLYKDQLAHLISTSCKSTPLIIDTPAWSKGFGDDILLHLTSLVDKPIIAYIHQENRTELIKRQKQDSPNLDDPLVLIKDMVESSPTTSYVELERGFHGPCNTSAKDLSAFRLSVSLRAAVDNNLWTCRLSALPPVRVSYDTGLSGQYTIQGIYIHNSQGMQPKDVHTAVNGTLVAVVALEKHIKIPKRTSHGHMAWITDPLVLSPATSKCLGIAVIQALDVDSRQVYLKTALRQSQIEQLDTNLILVRGSLELPLYELHDPCFPTAPYLSRQKGCGAGTETWEKRSVVRKNVMG